MGNWFARGESFALLERVMYLQRIVASAKGFGSSPQHEPEKIPITTSRDGRLSKKASKEKVCC